MGIKVVISYPATKPTNLWRVLHDRELAILNRKPLWRPGMPEVHPLYDNHHSPFQKWAQLASFGLNPWFTKERWTDAYHFRYWMTNNQGFGMRNDPRANFVLGKDLMEDLPRVEALVCGGSMIEGDKLGDWVRVKGLHFDTPVSLEYLQSHPQFWIRGVFVGGTGAVFRMLGDKYQGAPLIHPLIVNRDKGDLMIESWKLQPWFENQPPDPLKFYI